MNVLDRIVAAVAPQAGLRRARARAQMAMVRAYEGAQSNRRTEGWPTSRAGPIAEVRAGRVNLRSRSRALVRDNAWMTRALAVKVSNQIGTGIRPRAATDNPELNAEIDRVHAAWAAACAPESGGDLYAMQLLAARGRAESGEVLVALDRSGTLRPGGVPLALQVLEPDWIDDTADAYVRARDGWRDGIQFDDLGRRVAYRLYLDPPHETGFFAARRTRDVPAADIVHLFRMERPGQIRGVPDVSSAIMRMRDLDDYHDAALLLAKTQTLMGAAVVQPDGLNDNALNPTRTEDDGSRIETMSPAMVMYLRPGEDIKFNNPTGSGPFAEYTRVALHMIAAGLGVTYHQMTGDLREANYSSLRAGSVEFRRQVEQDQHLMLIPMLCQPIWSAFLTQAVLAGTLPTAALRAPAHWTPPRFELVDPIRDTEAIKSQVRAGLMSWPEAVSEMGYDPAEQLAEIAAWQQRIQAAGVVLDTDPSLTTAAGGAVNPAATSAVVLNGNPANA